MIQDVPAGDTGIAEASFIVEDTPLTIEHLRLVSEIRGYRDYTIQPDGIYDLGGTASVYFDVLGLSVGGAQEVWVKVPHLLLYDPQGRLVLRAADMLSERGPYDGVGGTYLFLNLDIPGDAPRGEYRAEVTVEDAWTGEAVMETFNFTME